MTYASINEAWGGISGSNQLTTPLEKSRHPIHESQINRRRKYSQPREHSANDLYQCKYGSHDCDEIFQQNKVYNERQKKVAEGLQKFLPNSPGPQDYTFLPQYPWMPWARSGYLMYGPQLSQQWYQNPFQTNPMIAQQIAQQQMYGNVGPMTPIGNYQQQGFFPMYPQYPMPHGPVGYMPLESNIGQIQKPVKNNVKRRENFEDSNRDPVKTGIIYFIFFLIALCVILCIFLICVVSTK